MGSTFKIGRIAGIPIDVHASWLIAVAFITWTISSLFSDTFPGWTSRETWTAAIFGALALFGSVLIHELAHSLTARRLGLPVRGITLFIFGGVSKIDGRYSRSRDEFLVAFAGPASSLVLGAVFWAMWQAFKPDRGDPSLALGIVSYLGLMNLLLGVFNLLPGFPLDGGRVLRSIVWGWSGNERRATRVAVSVGRLMAIGMIGLGAWQVFNGNVTSGIWMVFIGFFLSSAGRGEERAERARDAGPRVSLRAAVQRTTYLADATNSVTEVMSRAYGGNQRVVPVLDRGEPVGFFTHEDVLRFPQQELRNLSVGSVIRRERMNIFPLDGDAFRAIEKLRESGARYALVVAGEALVGVVDEAGLEAVIRLYHGGGDASFEGSSV